MTMPPDLASWAKLLGTLLSATGSALLSWRVRVLQKWIVNSLVAHEESISQLRKLAAGEPQSAPIIHGVTHHLAKVDKNQGDPLLRLGFLLLAVGMALTATSQLVAGN